MNLDPTTSFGDIEVKKLLDFKALAKRLPDGFTNIPHVIRNLLPKSCCKKIQYVKISKEQP